MASTFRVGIDMMRTLHASKHPACLFKLFDEVCAFHGVYNTHRWKFSKRGLFAVARRVAESNGADLNLSFMHSRHIGLDQRCKFHGRGAGGFDTGDEQFFFYLGIAHRFHDFAMQPCDDLCIVFLRVTPV